MEDYEKLQEKNEKRNKKYLNAFENYLKNQGLTTKTINKHLSNVDFYLNDYLNYYDIIKMENGVSEINMYLGDWFIRKCLWSSKTSIKENAASIKKFYKCMSELNYIPKENYDFLCSIIKNNMEIWLDNLEEYDNDTYDDLF